MSNVYLGALDVRTTTRLKTNRTPYERNIDRAASKTPTIFVYVPSIWQKSAHEHHISVKPYIRQWMELNNWAIDLFEEVKMHRLLAKTRPMASLRRKRSEVFFYLYDAKQFIYIEEGSISYKNPNHEDVLKREAGRYMS